MDNVFSALASLPRRKILAYLHAGPLSVGELAEKFQFSRPALSSHLRVLEQAGLIEREKQGQHVLVSLVPDRIANTVFAWASELCPVAGPLKRERRRGKERGS